ncbi:unnamed protein product [marine sediment metagenome]|uniref:Uncharacterized protein n=1 Tax=marine sediment metagenome TaxID=412755 RepID=X1KMR6_9ZZZZ
MHQKYETIMGGDPIPGPVSRFIPSIDEYLEATTERGFRNVPERAFHKN